MGESTTAARRPIKSRSLRISRVAAETLARCGVSANAISVAGMILAIIGGALLTATTWYPGAGRAFWIIAALCVLGRLICNMLDGMVAIATGTSSRLGELLNEAPDRVSDAAILIGLGYAQGSSPLMGVLAALLAVGTAYVRTLGVSLHQPADFRGPMGKQQRMFLAIGLGVFMGAAPDSVRFADLCSLVGASVQETYQAPAAVLAIIAVGSLVTIARRTAPLARQAASPEAD